jgi:3-methyladenine DNA glycosylase AlkD
MSIPDATTIVEAARAGLAARADPASVTPVLRTWIRAPDRWLRRTAVICQLGARERTDLALLTEAIEANLDDGDFFLRKGIGWALRQFARTDPQWVRAFVAAHPALSPLSRKEALKHL